VALFEGSLESSGMSNSLFSLAARSRRVRRVRRAGMRACRAAVGKDFGTFAFRVFGFFLVGDGAFAWTGLGLLLLLRGGAMVSLSTSEKGGLLCDVAPEGSGGRSGSILVVSWLPELKSSARAGDGAGDGAFGEWDSLRLRDALSGVDSSAGRKSSRSWSSMEESGPSIERKILACLLRVLIGPRIEVSAAGVSWPGSLWGIEEPNSGAAFIALVGILLVVDRTG
jgi:hypothetical protein